MSNAALARATLGGGCFWCLEAVFQRQPGVKRVRSGYAGGKIANPGYRQVCAGDSGHAEVVEIEFDSNETSYDKLLELFWACHDPTTLNRQGADVGTQYRSVIFYHDESQKRMAEASRAAAQSHFERPIVTEILAAPTFYPAEDYHQNYYQDNRAQPYCMYVIRPKMEKLGLE